MTARYWIENNKILSAEGELNERNTFTFFDGKGNRKLFDGNHFDSKESAFCVFLIDSSKKIESIQNDIEIIKGQL